MQIYRILFKHVIKKQKKYRDPSRTAISKNIKKFYNPYLQTMKGHRIYKGECKCITSFLIRTKILHFFKIFVAMILKKW